MTPAWFECSAARPARAADDARHATGRYLGRAPLVVRSVGHARREARTEPPTSRLLHGRAHSPLRSVVADAVVHRMASRDNGSMPCLIRRIGLVAVATALCGAAIWGLFEIYVSLHSTSDRLSFLALCVPIVSAMAAVLKWAYSHLWSCGAEPTAELQNALADRLADELAKFWDDEAGRRGLTAPIALTWRTTSAPRADPVEAEVSRRRFEPLPGLEAMRPEELRQGSIHVLHAAFGGLGFGRLMIVGDPGSGKTATAILLIQDALRHRKNLPDDERHRVPVPVMFSLHGWDPEAQRVSEWLATELTQTYRLTKKEADTLLREGKIAAILDGLDEIPKDLRPRALRALSKQAGFRLVLLARRDELKAAAAEEDLENAVAVELDFVPPDVAANYLEGAQSRESIGWRTLTKSVRQQDGHLAKALRTPLALTLLRDAYRRGEDVSELIKFSNSAESCKSAEDVIGYLLDRVLSVAYAKEPGADWPRYDLNVAKKTLTYIAGKMSENGTYDLKWWHISQWPGQLARRALTGLAAGIMFGITSGFEVNLIAGSTDGVAAGLVLGAITCLMAALVSGTPSLHLPRQFHAMRWHLPSHRRRSRVVGLLLGLCIGLAFGLADFVGADLLFGVGRAVLTAVVVIGAGTLLGGIVGNAFASGTTGRVIALTPSGSWRADRTAGLARGLALALLLGLADGLGAGDLFGLRDGIAFGLLPVLAGLMLGLLNSHTWSASLSFAQIAVRERAPITLLRFLEDARQRQILRAVGPVYQFRHARLQDRLASEAPHLARLATFGAQSTEDGQQAARGRTA